MSLVVNDPDAQPAVIIQPLGRLLLLRVLEEEDTVGRIVLPRSTTKYEGRSLQGEIVFVGLRVTDPDLVGSHGKLVLFDDEGCTWWKGSLMPNYLGAVLDEGEEYVLVPQEQILGFVEYPETADAGDGR